MDRRRFVEVTGLGLAGAAVPPATNVRHQPSRSLAPRGSGQAADIAVIGGGAFGGWTSFYLQQAQAQCVLIDAYGPGNPRSTSGGASRGIRSAYGDRAMYSRWAVRALDLWLRWEEEWEEDLLLHTGRVALAPELTDSIRSAMAVLDELGVEHELMQVDELVRRYPQFSPEGVGIAHWEPTAHTIRAARACRAVARAFEREGGNVRMARAMPGGSSGGRLDWISLDDGTVLEADNFVFACGPWLPRMFPGLLGERIATPRRDVFFFGTPPGTEIYGHPHLPNFSESGFYGFPSIDHGGVKVAPVGGQVRFDPDTDERIVVGYQVRRAQEYVARRFPGLAGQPVIDSRVCQLEDTSDEHFIIDRHPEWENVWLAGGGTGHAFKHGPVLGEYIAARVLGQETDSAYDAQFAL